VSGASSLVDDLLQPLPAERLLLSTRAGSALVKHPFFATVDWPALQELKVSPPFVPPPHDASRPSRGSSGASKKGSATTRSFVDATCEQFHGDQAAFAGF
jgi:hypothetical protein